MAILKLWKLFTNNSKPNAIDTVSKRFIDVFYQHGVQLPQIPRLFSEVRIQDLQSPEKLVDILTPQLLDKVANYFGVRVEWLEGVDDEIYAPLCCYKRPETFLQKFSEVYLKPDNDEWFPLQVLCTDRNLDKRNSATQYLAPVIVERIAEIGDEWIYRYYIFRDGYNWSEKSCRVELKALIRLICERFSLTAPLLEISSDEMKKILQGELVPREFLHYGLVSSPSLEDYAQTDDENGVARETEEIPDVLRYIEMHKLEHYEFEVPSPQYLDESVSPIQPAKPRSGKRQQTWEEVWEPVRIAAKLIWSDDDSLTVEEVIKKIKAKNVSKASTYTSSAIRKHIADLAPPERRGKPGRRPKKST